MGQESEVYERFGAMPDAESDRVARLAICGGIDMLRTVESIEWKLGRVDWNMTEVSFKIGMGRFEVRE